MIVCPPNSWWQPPVGTLISCRAAAICLQGRLPTVSFGSGCYSVGMHLLAHRDRWVGASSHGLVAWLLHDESSSQSLLAAPGLHDGLNATERSACAIELSLLCLPAAIDLQMAGSHTCRSWPPVNSCHAQQAMPNLAQFGTHSRLCCSGPILSGDLMLLWLPAAKGQQASCRMVAAGR